MKDPMEKNGQANAERNELVNKSSQMLRNDAKTLGLLMISAENFATVVGYRRARNAGVIEISGFRPTLPYAGIEGAPNRAAPEMPPMPEPAKKDNEKKDDQ
jgi:hypothetical protein